jgi:hypothetical protein
MMIERIELLGISFTMQFLILELEPASMILMASSDVSETSPSTLNLSNMVILCRVMKAS